MDLVPYIFHEQQEGNLCAQHCLNALLQGPYFTAIDLAELARQLDQKEQDALGNSGSRSGNLTSQNMDDSGFFSVQVISHALSIWNTQIIPWGAKEVSGAKAEPEREVSFICNLDQHWYTLRRFGPSTQRWYDLNSLHPEPRHMSATFLGMTLSQLEAEGYSIFVVRPLSKPESETTSAATPAETPVVEQSKVKEATTVDPPIESAPSSSATPVLNERQEMERIRRQRIEERERASNPQSSSSSEPSKAHAISDVSDSDSSNKRARIDNATEETKQPSKSILVDTPSFLPACEADGMAAAMPLVQGESQKSENQTFGGSGYRLGGSPPRSAAANISSLSPGFSLDDADAEDTDWEMMQAIAMSLEDSK